MFIKSLSKWRRLHIDCFVFVFMLVFRRLHRNFVSNSNKLLLVRSMHEWGNMCVKCIWLYMCVFGYIYWFELSNISKSLLKKNKIFLDLKCIFSTYQRYFQIESLLKKSNYISTLAKFFVHK
jgi:hypothetical protein